LSPQQRRASRRHPTLKRAGTAPQLTIQFETTALPAKSEGRVLQKCTVLQKIQRQDNVCKDLNH
jgi:hypothetical protein